MPLWSRLSFVDLRSGWARRIPARRYRRADKCDRTQNRRAVSAEGRRLERYFQHRLSYAVRFAIGDDGGGCRGGQALAAGDAEVWREDAGGAWGVFVRFAKCL